MMSNRWPALMTYRLAAEYLSLGITKVKELASSGELQVKKYSDRIVRIPKTSLDAWIENLPTERGFRRKQTIAAKQASKADDQQQSE